MTVKQKVVQHFNQIFGIGPKFLVRAPGRVNLIGEHTDYNDGYVMPIAIDREIWIALQPRTDHQVIVHSLDYNSTNSFNFDMLEKKEIDWIEYIKGVAWSLLDEGYPMHGWEGVLMGDIPIGAGLSSSAALEMASILSFSSVGEYSLTTKDMAKIGQKSENEWIGVKCGIMDQLISAGGKQDQALLIDCRTLDTNSIKLPLDCDIIVMDTSTRRGLMDSAYNDRRSECEAVAQFFNVQALRDVSLEQLASQQTNIGEIEFKRARHVISENRRTLSAVQAINDDNKVELGRLMYQSHVSLRDDFEVSSDALNVIVEAAIPHPDCIGARMTGAGFGGCAVALVKSGTSKIFAEQLSVSFQNSTGLKPQIYACKASNGAEQFHS